MKLLVFPLRVLHFVAFCALFRCQSTVETISQIHIAQGLTPESMTISWISTTDTSSEVRFGLESVELTQSARGNHTFYEFNYTPYDNYTSGMIHHVYLTNLASDTLYYYKCGNFKSNVTSELMSFYTMPAVGDKRIFSFAVIGDLGQSNESISTVDHVMQNERLEMILHPGDLSYADCEPYMWDSYGEMIERLASKRPWMVGPGNHEIEITPSGSTYLAFESRYKMPAIQEVEIGPVIIDGGNNSHGVLECTPGTFQSVYNYGNAFYSFEVASAHIIYLSAYSETDAASVQYKWLESDLATVDRSITPWLIIVMHCPWYSSNQDHYGELQTVLMRDSMEALFYKHHVNIVLTGHVHAYERTFPMFQNQSVSDGVTYITIGDSGNYGKTTKDYYEQPAWSAFRDGTQFGHGELTLINEHKMMWRWLDNIDREPIWKDQVMVCNSYFTTNC